MLQKMLVKQNSSHPYCNLPWFLQVINFQEVRCSWRLSDFPILWHQAVVTIDLFLPYLFYLGGDYQKFVVSRHIGGWGLLGLSMFNFKVHGLLAYTLGTTSSHPGPAWRVGPEFTERYLELWRRERSPIWGGKEGGWMNGTSAEACMMAISWELTTQGLPL